jgi:hypothetical protein
VPVIRKARTAPAPTPEQRANAAAAIGEAALSTFSDVVADLDLAISEAQDAEAAANEKADYYRGVALAAGSTAQQFTIARNKVTALLG